MNPGPLRIAVGAVVGISGTDRRCVVTQVLDAEKVAVRDEGSNHLPETVDVERIVHAPPSKVTGATAEAGKDGPGEHRDYELSQIPAEAWDKARRKWNIISPFINVHRPPRDEVKAAARAAGYHFTQLYRWMRDYRNSGGNLTSLLDRRRSVPKGTHRLHPHVEALLDQVVVSLYWTAQRLRLRKIDEAMRAECVKHHIPLEPPEDGSNLHKPHINTIRARIRERRNAEKEAKREGKNKVSRLTSQGGGFHASYPLEYVQIDHTPVDVILRDEATGYVVGKPYLTVAIDVYSRMVVGYYLAFEYPGALATGICVSQAILSKKAWLQEHAEAFKGSPPEWPCYGCPVTLHMDNGRDFQGEVVERACNKYGINVMFRPIRTPYMGAHIESLLGKLAIQFHSLPGSTFGNPQKRGKHYDSEKESALSLREFSQWLANAILAEYHRKPHSALEGQSPLQRWHKGMTEGSDRAPARGHLPDRFIGEAAERLRLDFLPFEERKISDRGVSIDKIRYMDSVLQPWINAWDPDRAGKHRSFVFRRDPRNIAFVYFWNPNLEKYETIPLRNGSRPPATLWELRGARKHLREDKKMPDSQHNEDLIFEAIERRREIEEVAAARKRKFKAAGKSGNEVRPKPQSAPAATTKKDADDEAPRTDTPRTVKPFGDVGLWDGKGGS